MPINYFFHINPPPGGVGSESAPFNVGKVRISARIFENKPIRARNRQISEFFFNHITLSNIKSDTMNDLEITHDSDNESSSRGVTFKKIDSMYQTFLARRKYNNGTSEDSAIDFTSVTDETTRNGSFNAGYINAVTAEDTTDIMSLESMEFYPKYYKKFTNSRTEAIHSCFYQNGSIYATKDMHQYSIEIRNGERSFDEEDLNKFADFIDSLEPDIGMVGLAPETQEKTNKKQQSDGDDDEAEGSRDICYNFINCAYPGNFYKKAKEIGILEHFTAGTSYIRGDLVSNTQKSYMWLPPGKHSSFKKLTPIFPGEDFSIEFRKTSHDSSVCTTQPTTGSVAYRMIDRLKFLDPHYVINGYNPYTPQMVPPNFGVAKFVLDEESNKLRLSNNT